MAQPFEIRQNVKDKKMIKIYSLPINARRSTEWDGCHTMTTKIACKNNEY